jgi:hypothetical protein
MGRLTNSPLHFGQIPTRSSAEQRLQYVHSNEQIMASREAGGKAEPHFSHSVFISSISILSKGQSSLKVNNDERDLVRAMSFDEIAEINESTF